MQKYKDYVIVDLETTGISIKKRKIIEYALIKVRDSKIIDVKTDLINPNVRLRKKIIELTNISDEMLKDRLSIEDVILDIVDFIGDDIIIAHNISFDYSFLKKEADKLNINFNKKGIDTLELCRNFMPKENKKTLKSACEFFGISISNNHRAYFDAYNTYLLYEKLVSLYPYSKIFEAKDIEYTYKKEKKASIKEKDKLIKLLNSHKISIKIDLDNISMNEISRIRDYIKADKINYLEEYNEKK